MKNLRFLSVVLLLVLTELMLHVHANADVVPASDPLSQVPDTIAGWTGRTIPIDQSSLDVLGAGDFISRLYQRGETAPQIGLFIAYFPTQRTGATIHSPKNCLPGAGWYFESSKYVSLVDDAGRPQKVGEYVITNGAVKQFVIYWYLAHGRSVANEYLAKFYLVEDAMRTNRTDGSLIRVMTPVDSKESLDVARSRVESFTRQLMPMLPRFIPN